MQLYSIKIYIVLRIFVCVFAVTASKDQSHFDGFWKYHGEVSDICF